MVACDGLFDHRIVSLTTLWCDDAHRRRGARPPPGPGRACLHGWDHVKSTEDSEIGRGCQIITHTARTCYERGVGERWRSRARGLLRLLLLLLLLLLVARPTGDAAAAAATGRRIGAALSIGGRGAARAGAGGRTPARAPPWLPIAAARGLPACLRCARLCLCDKSISRLMRCHLPSLKNVSGVFFWGFFNPTISTSISTETASIKIRCSARLTAFGLQQFASFVFQLRPSQAGFQCRLESVV